MLPKDTCSHTTQKADQIINSSECFLMQEVKVPLFKALIVHLKCFMWTFMCVHMFKNHTSSEWSPYDSAYGSDPLLHVTLRASHQQEWFVAYTCSILFSTPPWKHDHISLLSGSIGQNDKHIFKPLYFNLQSHTQSRYSFCKWLIT